MPRKSRQQSSPSASNADRYPYPSLKDGKPLPKLAVFDLDYTLWPFWCDTHPTPPMKPHPTKPLTAIDAYKEAYTTYGPTLPLLKALKEAGIRIAVASRTHAPDLGRKLMVMLGVDEFVDRDLREIYPGSKMRHMRALKAQAKVEYDEMLFFDDEGRNREVESLGVGFVLVRDGVSPYEWERGVKEWREKRKKAGKLDDEGDGEEEGDDEE